MKNSHIKMSRQTKRNLVGSNWNKTEEKNGIVKCAHEKSIYRQIYIWRIKIENANLMVLCYAIYIYRLSFVGSVHSFLLVFTSNAPLFFSPPFLYRSIGLFYFFCAPFHFLVLSYCTLFRFNLSFFSYAIVIDAQPLSNVKQIRFLVSIFYALSI